MKLCPNCSSSETTLVYHMTGVVTFQNVPILSLQSAFDVPRGDLEIYYYHTCTLLYNGAFDASLTGYGEQYENSQNHSYAFNQHTDGVINIIIGSVGKKWCSILEIGCGDGAFLKKLSIQHGNNYVVGYDKSLKSASTDKNFSLCNRYYSCEDVGGYDLVISRHVIEHILDNHAILSVLNKKNTHAHFFLKPLL